MVERDRKWMNIYRGKDAARQLPEAEFDQVISFCRSAQDTAMAFKQNDAADTSRPPSS